MTELVIVEAEQATAAWLTEVLGRSGALSEGAVASVSAAVQRRELSIIVRLALTYNHSARGALPRRLFLKLVNADMDDESFGPSEVNYYVRDYAGVPGAPIPRCYDGVYSASLRRYHVLLDDLSETHVAAHARPPTAAHGFALAEGLAAMHAQWWGSARVAVAGAAMPDASAIDRFVAVARPGAAHIVAACAEQLKPHRVNLIGDLFERHPAQMAARTRDGNGFTLIHGDTNLSNILVPMEGDRPLYIVDRQPFDWSLTTWLAVYDLAYTMVLKWPPVLRRELEQPILRHYLDKLMQRGVRGYHWEQLWADYRLCAAMGVYVATEWCRGGVNWDTIRYWMPMLQRSLHAMDDQECAALWR